VVFRQGFLETTDAELALTKGLAFMSPGKSEKNGSEKPPRHKKDRAAEIANTFEWLITAFVLAFVFRAFVMEAFRIPTGSMADTLKGAHFPLRCRQCGYKYEHGFVPRNYGLPDDTIPRGNVPLALTRCPNCGLYPPKLVCRTCAYDYKNTPAAARGRSDRNTNSGGNTPNLPSRCPRCNRYLLTDKATPVANGDRILVLKCIYQFFEPKRWDVIVFKNPPDPTINYIKRLIGLPGERVQIFDGDVYIEGQISRKPPKVQNELWMPVYDNDYQPVRPGEDSFNGHVWQQPFRNVQDSKWITTDGNSPTIFRLDSPADELNTLVYDTSIGNDFKATYAYDDIDGYPYMPYCSDLMVRFYCRATDSQGRIGIALSKYQTNYKAWVDLTGEMVITEEGQDGKSVERARRAIDPPVKDGPALVKFANVDHELIFQFGGEKLTYDLGRDLEDAVRMIEDTEPRAEIFGSGKLMVSHIGIFRDIHYTAAKFANSSEYGRATKDNPFVLGEDEFFVLGDNSPNSEDARWWSRSGEANKGLSPYRVGVVPRDYLVGKALFVYWPSGFRPFPEFPFGIIPNVGRMHFVYGGSNATQ
jgi:signal peptidase I